MSTIIAQTLSNGTVSTSTANCIQGSAKAWANFNGSTATIQSSFNVSSITRNTSGDYTVNFTTAMANANYVPVFTGAGGLSGVTFPTYGTFVTDGSGNPTTKTTSAVRYTNFNPYTPNAGGYDLPQSGVVIFGS